MQLPLWFVPAVIAVALVTFGGWLAFGPSLSHALVAAVAILTWLMMGLPLAFEKTVRGTSVGWVGAVFTIRTSLIEYHMKRLDPQATASIKGIDRQFKEKQQDMLLEWYEQYRHSSQEFN